MSKQNVSHSFSKTMASISNIASTKTKANRKLKTRRPRKNINYNIRLKPAKITRTTPTKRIIPVNTKHTTQAMTTTTTKPTPTTSIVYKRPEEVIINPKYSAKAVTRKGLNIMGYVNVFNSKVAGKEKFMDYSEQIEKFGPNASITQKYQISTSSTDKFAGELRNIQGNSVTIFYS